MPHTNLIDLGARLVFGRMLPRIAYPVLWGPLQGARFILGSLAGEGGGARVYFNKIEPEQTSAFTRTIRTGMVFFDIGANVGYYTILGSRLVGPQGKVFAFEPVMRNLAYLYRHASINKSRNITIIPAACSDTLSLAAFSPGTNHATGHLARDTESRDSVPVPAITVDEVVQKLGFSPDVIKIDVEGAELSVLRGAQTTLRRTKPQIFLSTHSGPLRTSCLGYLQGHGYSCKVLSRDRSNPSEFLAIHGG